jgi:hypothetical protein
VADRLEPRIALSATVGVNPDSNQVGVNLDFNMPYNADPIWTDLHNLAFQWEAPGTTTGWTSPDTAIPLTANDYPLANAATSFDLANYPDGDYQFSYTGAATVAFSDIGQLAGPVTISGGVTTGTVVVNHESGDGQVLDMQVSGLNSADPMGNFHLMMPGYGNGTTSVPMFTPAFLKSLQPFSNIRFMNWGLTNDSTVTNWSDRVTPADFITDGTNVGGTDAVPFEDMIELCNEAQKDMWINVPALATPAFVQDLAQLIHADLDPNLNVYVEYSNETWNNGFNQFWQILSAAQANPLVTQNASQPLMVAQQSAYEEVSIAKTFDQIFGSQAARVRPIMAAQEAWSQVASWELQFIQQNYGPPSQFIYASAVAPYVSLTGGENVAGLTLNQVFADLNQDLDSDIVPSLESDAAVAEQYGVPLVAYEGGQSLVPGANDLNFGVMQQAQNDPRMYQLYVSLMKLWQEAGGGLFDSFQLDGIGGQYGFWGLLPNVLATGSQKYDALLSVILPAGDANLDGIVDAADFQVLEANYGQGNTDWEQGDFDDSGSTNWNDLNLLRQDLDPAGFTLSQFAQQAVFGEPSTVTSPTALEYDGYGVTYASDLPIAASSGTLELNLDSQGQAIVLGGASYSEGLGVLANSSTTLALDGKDTRFESTIGVDGSSNSGSSVIFDVYGDGKLLYQSPTLTYASGAVPIDVNVAGVTNLTLTVSPAPGSNPSTDNAVWADARVVSTANFGSAQPYTLTWQLSRNGTVLSTQTTDSFVFGAISGTYTLTLTVTNAQGNSASANTSVTVTSGTAGFIASNATTGGNWIGTYGSQGYDVVGNAVSLPSYATVTTSGASTGSWAATTTDPRALQNAIGSSAIAACWYASTSFTVDVDLTDGQEHDLELYFLDWDSGARSETVQFSNAATGAVLDTETVSSFHAGVYLEWMVSGNVLITITHLAGANAVLSGLFLDPTASQPPPTPPPLSDMSIDPTTEGNWIGTYGSQGYDIMGSAASLPSYATVTFSGASTGSWAATTTDPRALQNPSGTGRAADCWVWWTSFTVDVDLTDGQTHDLELYFLDWDSTGRSEQVQISDAATGTVLNTDVNAFHSGLYLECAVSGNVLITITHLAGANAVLSGVFLDPASTATPAPISTPTPPTSLPIPAPIPTLNYGPTAVFLNRNTTTQGNWIGTYGAQGYDVIGNATSLPSYATVTPSGQSNYTWAASTTDPRALQDAVWTGRIAACWYATASFTVDVNLTDGQTHDLELYFDDWDNSSRSEQVQISSATTGAVLDTETVSSFTSGVYLDWKVSGNIVIKFTRVAGTNAVLNGLFLDPVSNSTSTAAVVEQTMTNSTSTIPLVEQDGQSNNQLNINSDSVSDPGQTTLSSSISDSFNDDDVQALAPLHLSQAMKRAEFGIPVRKGLITGKVRVVSAHKSIKSLYHENTTSGRGLKELPVIRRTSSLKLAGHGIRPVITGRASAEPWELA